MIIQTRYIKAIARHNGLFLILLGSILLSITLLLSRHYWQQFTFALMFIISACLVTIFIGILKRMEPKHSLVLSEQQCTFYHRHGSWQLLWSDIRNIFPVTDTQGIERIELNYIGIRLEHLETIGESISLRLANRLIHEQKPLIQYCIKAKLITFEQGIINFEPFQLSNGTRVKGPLAAFLHHSHTLYNALGAHLYINQNSLNSSIADFSQLANEYIRHKKSQ